MATSNLPNLYDFLRRLLSEARAGAYNTVEISRADQDWLEQFLKGPDHELHFKAKRMPGGTDDNPIYAQDYAIAGDEVDIFSLVTEAMMQNPNFARVVQLAAKFFQEHLPTCPTCQADALEATMQPSWNFKPHPVKERESPCPKCETGELLPVGYTQPNGQQKYECNECGHETSFP